MIIDILMTAFNGEAYIAGQIESILHQDHGDLRLIIRDDGSSDHTVEIIKSFSKDPRIILISDELGNLGASSSFMQLVKYSSSHYFMFADQDDIWLPNKISLSFKKLREMESETGENVPSLVFTDLKVASSDGNIIDESFWHYQKLDPALSLDWKRLLAQNVVTGSTIIANSASKSVIMPYLFPEMFYDHWIAVNIARNGRIGYLTNATNIYRQHESNVEGAKIINVAYYLSRSSSFFQRKDLYRRLAEHFTDVGQFMLLYYKIAENLKRLFR